ncbi:MAG: UTP--glucose-1-phosphate uridylyltransferase [Chloroflexi bacterium 13_1_20CM_66_33]|nr:MAG: UTP--glucose-1-phosphate uridylyltransferase [Chloroflexi bacterium 13_1_20CM_66_33]TME77137.1 MAG: UTP--glucose-1-phosphate uridylyltransferase GalU [Chloroflexota bacterium]TMF22492.1 MAG: UTP--glucose-1-phosphate uridylyltransferase GalU [Chloroflexota bacterium]TMF42031.1 MAG: UTP--glucose-1-phosphate uridylyltransferase GalU [Chloroflexota bacterium]TMG14155.1 MAG: UTP--glucose-1-phosphate uridylyltransferase GalU [Chloroflexota bacterium]
MTAIRKAVFPAAGLGTRFLPATKAQPKEMLPVVDKPIIQYGVEEAVAAGIDQIIVVTGRDKRAIVDHFDISFELEHYLKDRGKTRELQVVRKISDMVDITYIHQKEPLGLGHAVLMAKDVVGNEPFAVFLADDIIRSQTPVIKQMMEVYAQQQVSVLALQRVEPEQVSRYGVVKVAQSDGRIHEVVDMVEKPDPTKAPSNLAILGRYLLKPSIFGILETTHEGVGGEIQLTDALRTMAQQEKMLGLEFDGTYFDVGTVSGFLKTSIAFALERPGLREELLSYLKSLDGLSA